MSRKIKIIILLILSLSVYFIYQINNQKSIKVISLGDNLSLGINSYGIKNYSYIDYYKDFIKEKYSKVEINKKYSNSDLTIFELLEKIKTSPEIKRDIRESNILILNVGYNDIIYKLSLEKNLTQNLFQKRMNEITNSYQQLIKEIKKYYVHKIIVIGYYQRNINDYYQNLGIRKLNSILKDNSEIIYINTIFLLNNSNNYFQNPNSYYPNQLAYQKIAEEIYKKTLENNIII